MQTQWQLGEQPLRRIFFEPDISYLNEFISRAYRLMMKTQDSVSPLAVGAMDTLMKESLQFVADVIKHRNVQFKVFVVLLLVRSNKDIREKIVEKERPEVIQPFLVYLDHELQRLLTGLRPPTAIESLEMKKSGEELRYVRDDSDQTKYHCVEFFVFRIGRFYRRL